MLFRCTPKVLPWLDEQKSLRALGTWPLPKDPYHVRLVSASLDSASIYPFFTTRSVATTSVQMGRLVFDVCHPDADPLKEALLQSCLLEALFCPLVSQTHLEPLNPELVSIYLPPTEVIQGQLTHPYPRSPTAKQGCYIKLSKKMSNLFQMVHQHHLFLFPPSLLSPLSLTLQPGTPSCVLFALGLNMCQVP